MDGQLVSQKSSNENYPMIFEYNTDGQPIGFVYRNMHYYYLTNQMGDVIGITNANGVVIAYYDYDEWGNLLAIVTATEGNTQQMDVAMANPLRYRGYYYDNETGYYYLQSRYYEPSICRFINADVPEFLGFGQSLAKWNLFSYCENEPVNNVDYIGYAKISLTKYRNKNWLTKIIVKAFPNVYTKNTSEMVLYNKSFLGVRLEIIIGVAWQTNASALFGFLLDSSALELTTFISAGKGISYSFTAGVKRRYIYTSIGISYAGTNAGPVMGLAIKLSVSYITAAAIAICCVAAPYF